MNLAWTKPINDGWYVTMAEKGKYKVLAEKGKYNVIKFGV